jgi:hypothetical protein
MQPHATSYEPAERLSLCDKLEAYLRAHPNKWVSAHLLMGVAGQMAWRTRVSDLRKRGMRIENRVRTIKRDGSSFKTSEYLFVPEGQ